MIEINFIEAQIREFVEKMRPPAEIRDRLDLGFTFTNNIFDLFEIRPVHNISHKKTHTPVARARFVKSRQIWKLYWPLSGGGWQAYEPALEIKATDNMLREIELDKYGCFWG